MAASAGATTPVIASMHTNSHRVKFNHRESLELEGTARPGIVYNAQRMLFFAFDGVVMYTFECVHRDFDQRIIKAIEFSNRQWSE